MVRSVGRVAALLFGSGLCALIYEIAWLREFRLVFGASTAANAAVLAIFIAGLGSGGLVLGRRVDRSARPLFLYASFEGAIAVLAGLSPLLLIAARSAYIGLGGIAVLGSTGASVVRLFLTVIVLFGPTFLMGGTLPAAARAVASDEDARRRAVGVLYGCNTLGAVAGCLLANFWMLEAFGTRRTLWIASAVNVVVALVAVIASRWSSGAPASATGPADASAELAKLATSVPIGAEPSVAQPSVVDAQPSDAPLWFALLGSGVVGFVFFLMELVWYRMLSPILGGTVFMFGIILAVALLGIGLGGLAYAALAPKRITIGVFAVTCLVEAAFVAFPYFLGDRVAIGALLLRVLGSAGFSGFVISWSLVTLIVVFPAAFLSGVQFPMLIAMVGRGRDHVGGQTGLVYAANTAGAILGALSGGFGLLPALTVPGCWRLSVWMLAGLGLLGGLYLIRRPSTYLVPLATIFGVAGVAWMLGAEGPTSVWRHSPIAVGRIPAQITPSPNSMHAWLNGERRSIQWWEDGVESTVALNGRTGWSFVVNGKSDGHARTDAATQVMVGLVGAILRPNAKRAMVVGLGTGSTAGWLGAVPTMERVDVAELESAILHVADVASPVNRDVLHNSKVHISIGDARETLLTSREKYDVIASEPSNPYRAGVASLFTEEYYRAVKQRLADDGIFLQWVQAYNVDNRTLRSVYATLGNVFPEVETWELRFSDLLLVASNKRTNYDLKQLRETLSKEPYRSAVANAWRTVDAEGFLGHFVARSSFAKAIAFVDKSTINTDDKNLIEFGFARTAAHSAGDTQGGRGGEIREVARARGEHRPVALENEIDWGDVDEQWAAFRTTELGEVSPMEEMTEERRHRIMTLVHFLGGRHREAAAEWRAQPREPIGPAELAVVAEVHAEIGDDAARAYIDRLRVFQPAEADAILARLHLRQGRVGDATQALTAAFETYRTDPWPWPFIMEHAFSLAKELGTRNAGSIAALRPALANPFSVHMLDEARLDTVLSFVVTREPDATCADALAPFEPNIPWQQPLLTWRSKCYSKLHHDNAERAAKDLQRFVRDQPLQFGSGLNFIRVGP